MLTIIDYKTGGNIFSVKNSVEALGIEHKITSSAQDILQASHVLFPGVGSFEACIQSLHTLNIFDAIKKRALDGRPFLGICVGMQVMFEGSTEYLSSINNSENTITKGLALFKGMVERFSFEPSPKLKIPHMGWNTKHSLDHYKHKAKTNELAKVIPDDNYYFVHSYRVEKTDDLINANKELHPHFDFGYAEHGEEFICSINNGKNLFGAQFHPEKSGKAGLKILENFCKL